MESQPKRIFGCVIAAQKPFESFMTVRLSYALAYSQSEAVGDDMARYMEEYPDHLIIKAFALEVPKVTDQ